MNVINHGVDSALKFVADCQNKLDYLYTKWNYDFIVSSSY